MGLFTWNEIYSLDHPQIDREHKALFSMAEELQRAMLEGRGKDVLTGLLSRLIDYTRVHFDHEAELMRQCRYPQIIRHLGEHRGLTNRVLELKTQWEGGNVSLPLDMLQFLRTWLDRHIRESDHQVAVYIRSQENALSHK